MRRHIRLWATAILAWLGVGLSVTLQILSVAGLDVVAGLIVLWPLAFVLAGVSRGLDLLPKRRIAYSPYLPWRYLREEIGTRLTWVALGTLIYSGIAIVTLICLEVIVGQVHGNTYFHNGRTTIATPAEIRSEHARIAWGFSAGILINFVGIAFIATKRLRRMAAESKNA